MAIKGPLENTRRYFAPRVAEKLVDDLLKLQIEKISPFTVKRAKMMREYVEPILIQIVCTKLWQRLPKQTTQITQVEVEDILSSVQ